MNGTHSEYILRGFLLNDLLSPIKTALSSPACVSKGFTRYHLVGFFPAVDLRGIPLLEGKLSREDICFGRIASRCRQMYRCRLEPNLSSGEVGFGNPIRLSAYSCGGEYSLLPLEIGSNPQKSLPEHMLIEGNERSD